MITYGSVCSGIEAATVAWSPIGYTPAWFSEIEKFPSEVLAHHYPDVPNLGDMLTLPEKVLKREIPAPMVLVGGTPCQSFSVAGKRGGLDDARGALTMAFIDLADAIDEVRKEDGHKESIIVWENVPGVLSSKDNAFGCFLGALAGESCEFKPSGKRWSNAGYILGPKRAIAWRILDAQYFGVAQRRRRVFVVASARAGFCPAKVLFEFEGVRRDTPPSRKTGQAATRNAETGTVSAGSYGEVTGALCARDHKGVGNQYVTEGKLVVDAYGIPGNWIGRKPENGGNSTQFMREVAPSQTATDKHGVIALSEPTVVRRLTPVECERLQGFPDGYTAIPWRNQPAENCPDGHRYKALGNSMAVPVMRWIGERIREEL